MTKRARPTGEGRKGNNEGTIYQSKDGMWHARVITGLTVDGKPIRKHRQARSEQEVRKKFDELITERDKRIPAEGRKKLLVADIIAEHVEHVMSKKPSPRDHRDEKGYIRGRLLPAFGSIPVKAFDVAHMDKVYQDWLTDPVKPIKPATIRRIHAILSVSFSTAMKRRRIDFDVTKLVTLPAIEPVERHWLTLEEVEQVLAAAADQDDWVRWAIALNMGLRQGEVLGLRWRDVRLKSKEALVQHALSRFTIPEHACGGTCGRRYAGDCVDRWSHGCGGTCGYRSAEKCPNREGVEALVLGSTKENRKKLLPIPETVFQALIKHKEQQEGLQRLAGSDWCDFDFVFTNSVGRPLDPRRDHDAWKTLLKKAGLPAARLHDARHATGSGLDAIGASSAIIKDALGHSSTRVTERYIHTQPAGVREAFDALSQVVVPSRANASEQPRTETETETGCAFKNRRNSRKPRNTGRKESRLSDLNRRPTHYECVALPLS